MRTTSPCFQASSSAYMHAMKRSLLSLSPLISSARLSPGALHHGFWLRPRICVSARHSTLSTGSLRQPLARLWIPPSVSQEQSSIVKFVAARLLRATHRSGINNRSRGGYRGYGGGPGGPWQRLRDRINAIPGNVLFWGIIGLNGIVFVSWNLAWAKYVSCNRSLVILHILNNAGPSF